MNATELDDALAAAAAPVSPAASAEATRLAYEVMPARLARGRAPRARWLVPALVIGAVALTGGVGTATLTMSHWAQVSMPIDSVRNDRWIPLTWTDEEGTTASCRAWVELRNPGPDDRELLDAAIQARDWSGIGQSLFDGADLSAGDPEAQSRVSRAFEPILREFIDEVFPGIPWHDEAADSDARGVLAVGTACAPVTP